MSELGGFYVGQLVANEMLHEMMYGKKAAKKNTIFSLVKKLFK